MSNAKTPPQTAAPIYQIKITVKGTRPPVWRRLLIAGDEKLAALHKLFQRSLGWSDTLLHHFEIGTSLYTTPDPNDTEDCGPEFEDARLPTLQSLFPEAGAELVYLYDYSDQWEHDVVIEKLLPRDATQTYPRCLAGAGACPPEDCGGPAAYRRILKQRAAPEAAVAAEAAGALPAGFDPDAFDLDAINRRLTA